MAPIRKLIGQVADYLQYTLSGNQHFDFKYDGRLYWSNITTVTSANAPWLYPSIAPTAALTGASSVPASSLIASSSTPNPVNVKKTKATPTYTKEGNLSLTLKTKNNNPSAATSSTAGSSSAASSSSWNANSTGNNGQNGNATQQVPAGSAAIQAPISAGLPAAPTNAAPIKSSSSTSTNTNPGSLAQATTSPQSSIPRFTQLPPSLVNAAPVLNNTPAIAANAVPSPFGEDDIYNTSPVNLPIPARSSPGPSLSSGSSNYSDSDSLGTLSEDTDMETDEDDEMTILARRKAKGKGRAGPEPEPEPELASRPMVEDDPDIIVEYDPDMPSDTIVVEDRSVPPHASTPIATASTSTIPANTPVAQKSTVPTSNTNIGSLAPTTTNPQSAIPGLTLLSPNFFNNTPTTAANAPLGPSTSATTVLTVAVPANTPVAQKSTSPTSNTTPTVLTKPVFTSSPPRTTSPLGTIPLDTQAALTNGSPIPNSSPIPPTYINPTSVAPVTTSPPVAKPAATEEAPKNAVPSLNALPALPIYTLPTPVAAPVSEAPAFPTDEVTSLATWNPPPIENERKEWREHVTFDEDDEAVEIVEEDEVMEDVEVVDNDEKESKSKNKRSFEAEEQVEREEAVEPKAKRVKYWKGFGLFSDPKAQAEAAKIEELCNKMAKLSLKKPGQEIDELCDLMAEMTFDGRKAWNPVAVGVKQWKKHVNIQEGWKVELSERKSKEMEYYLTGEVEDGTHFADPRLTYKALLAKNRRKHSLQKRTIHRGSAPKMFKWLLCANLSALG